MRLNKSTSQAIRILVDCARAGETYSKVAVLADRLDISLQNVFKLVHLLSRAGLVTALRGRHGGVRLTRPAGEIRVGDVVRAMEALEIESVSGTSTGADRRTAVDVLRVLDDAMEAFIAILDRHTLADLAGKSRSPAGTTAGTVNAQSRKSGGKPTQSADQRAAGRSR